MDFRPLLRGAASACRGRRLAYSRRRRMRGYPRVRSGVGFPPASAEVSSQPVTGFLLPSARAGSFDIPLTKE